LFSSLLAFSLTVFVWSAPAQQISSPTPTLSAREELIAEIKGYAERHVKTDSSMQTSTVLKLYESNPVGLKAPEIAKIYEEEYSRLKETKEANPWENVIPKIGWVAAGILAFWLAFQESLKKSLEKLFEVINTAIYNRFAGSKLFQGVALRRYQKALIEKHKELKIPFRSKPLQMQEVYVPLKVVDGHDKRKETDKKEGVDACRAIAESRRLMIKGAPGAGKSMLLKHIALNYAENGFATSGQYVPILLELHRLSDRTKSINQYLVEALERDDFPKADRFVAQGLKNGTLLLLFDGLDEVNSAERQEVVQRIKDLIDHYSKCRVLITCRTQVYKNEFSEVVDRTLEVVEFTDQEIQNFLQPWQSSMTADKSVEQLLRNLHDRPRIMALARNPLMLTIIAYLYTDTPFVLPHSRSEFYQKSTELLLDQWHQEHNQFPARDKKSVLRHLALYNQDSVNHQQQDRRSIDYLTVIAEVKRVLPSLNIDIEKAEGFLKEIVERSGLLLEIDGGERYQFAHLTLQEYFAAAKLIEDEQGLITRFEKDPDGWREVVKLWCGLAEDSTNIIEQIFDIDKNTAFECLADAQRVDEVLADRIIDDFKVNLAAVGQEDVIAKAFGAVAADMRPRGKAVFNFLVATLATDPEKSRRVVAANALSMTNLPEAAKVLAEQYIAHPEAGQPLVRMGDLAVEQLASLAELGHFHVLDDLNQIATPKAANALVGLLFHKDSKIANRAAWHLASLIMLPTIEDSLRGSEHGLTESEVSDSQDYATGVREKEAKDYANGLREKDAKSEVGSYIGWIWNPFEEPINSKLPFIAGVIAYLLEHSSSGNSQQSVPKIDPRIAIPLLSVQMFDEIKLPKNLSDDADAFLEKTVMDDALNRKIIKLIEDTLGAEESCSPWRFLLSGLPPQLQLKLLHSLINNRRPQKSDWQRIFKPLKYTFSKSWHYRTILIVASIASLIALVQMFYPIVLGSKNGIDWFMAMMYPLIVYFWIALRKGINEPWEPSLFVNLGLFGSITFGTELSRFFRNSIVWSGIEILFNSLSSASALALNWALALALFFVGVLRFVGALALNEAWALALSVALVGAWAWALAGTLGGTFAWVVASPVASAVALNWAFAWVVASAVASAVAFGGTLAWVGVGAGVGVGVGAGVGAGWLVLICAGVGIGIWHSKKIDNKIIKLFAFLSFPLFCWFPLVAYLSTTALLRFLPWQNVALTWIVVIATCTALWFRGQQLDYQSRNPLQGLIPNPKESQGISLKKSKKGLLYE
jgi:hypothetical protein